MLKDDNLLEKENWIVSDDVHDSEKHDQESLKRIGPRIDEIARIKHLDYSRFAEKSNIDYGELVSVIAGQKGAPATLIDNVLRAFPDISSSWLCNGVGNAINPTKSVNKQQGIPLIPIEAVAGFGKGDQTGVRYEDCEQYNVPEFLERGVEFLIRVSGSSMYPKYANGDILACKKIHEILFIQWGKVHVIESKSQGALVKRIFQHDEDTVQCVSDNKENYPPFYLPKSDIRSLSIVVGVIRLE